MNFFNDIKEFFNKLIIVQKNIVLIATSSFFINILGLTLPLVVLQTYDRIIPGKGQGSLAFLVALVLGALVCEIVLRHARSYLICWSAAAFEHQESTKAIDHVTNISIDDFYQTSTQNILGQFNQINKIRQFLSGQAIMALIDLPFIFVYLSLIYYIAGSTIIYPFIFLIIVFFISINIGQLIEKLTYEKEGIQKENDNYLFQVFNNILNVRTNAIEHSSIQDHYFKQKKENVINYKLNVLQSMSQNNGALYSQVLIILIVTIGAIKINNEEMGIGALAACTILAGRIMQPIQKTLTLWTKFKSFLLAHEEFYKLMNFETKKYNASETSQLGKITFENVSKSVQNIKYISNLDLALIPGDSIRIDTSDQVANHTLIKLLLGSTSPDIGHVTVNGHDPFFIENSFISTDIAYVSPTNKIFKGTIWENLSCFNSISKKHILGLASKLGLDDTISMLPKGYDTFLTNTKADPVSEGIKNLICIIRSLASEPKIIILNNIESSLDKSTYNKLYKYLINKKSDKLYIFFSDDLNFASLCNSHYEIIKGKLVNKEVLHAS